MGDPIISQETIRRMARAAFNRGDTRDSCAMKDWAPAKATWLEEYDRCVAEAQHGKHAPAAAVRFDLSQGAV